MVKAGSGYVPVYNPAFPVSYSANFMSGNLPVGAAFSRASNAMQYNSAGYLVWAPSNLCLYSYNWVSGGASTYWATINTSLALNSSVLGPDGLQSNQFNYSVGTAGSSAIKYTSTTLANVATSWTASVWLKADNAITITLRLYSNGVGYLNTQTANVTTTWQQFSVTGAATIADTGQLIFDMCSAGTAGINIYGADCQLEYTSYNSPQAYNATNGSQYYGRRLEYNPSTLALNGSKLETQSTNLVTYSTPSSTNWTLSASVITSNSTTGPDNMVDASLIGDTTASSAHYVYTPNISLTSGNSYTYSIFAKAGTNETYIQITDTSNTTFYVNFSLSASGSYVANGSGVTATIQQLPNSWYRCSMTFTAGSTATSNLIVALLGAAGSIASARLLSYTGVSGNGIYATGAQAENIVYPTSFIPTNSLTVTRAADFYTLPGLTFNQSQGSAILEFATGLVVPSNAYIMQFSDGTVNNRYLLYTASSTTLNDYFYTSLTNVFNSTIGAMAPSTIYRAGMTYKTGAYAGSLLSNTLYTNSSPTPMGQTLTTFELGSSGIVGAGALNGWLRNFQYWQYSLPNSMLHLGTK